MKMIPNTTNLFTHKKNAQATPKKCTKPATENKKVRRSDGGGLSETKDKRQETDRNYRE